MISKTEMKELEAMISDMCAPCADRLRGWVEAQRGKAARKRKPSIAPGALDKAVFIRALTACGKVAKRAIGAAVQGVSLRTGPDGMTVDVTDGELFVMRRFPTCKYSSVRRSVFDSRALLRWLRSRKAKGIDAISIDDRGLRVEMGGESVTLKSLGDPEGVWPKPPDGKLKELATLSAPDLRRMIKRVSFAATDAVMRYAINSVNLHSYKGGFYAAALDGRRLAIAGPVGKAAKGKALVPLFAAGIVADLLADIGGDVSVCTMKQKGGGWVAVESNDLQVRVREAEGTPPNYREVIPVDGGVRVDVDRVALLAAVDDAAVFRRKDQFGNDDGNLFRLTAAPGGLAIRPLSDDFSGRSIRVAGPVQGERFSAAVLNPAFLHDALKALNDSILSIELHGFWSPMVIRGDHFCYVLQPFSSFAVDARRKRQLARAKAAAAESA